MSSWYVNLSFVILRLMFVCSFPSCRHRSHAYLLSLFLGFHIEVDCESRSATLKSNLAQPTVIAVYTELAPSGGHRLQEMMTMNSPFMRNAWIQT